MEVGAPLRLSVEERVEKAVREAVRRALANQRRTQEEELDALSDVLQRSLAALAGERDRALRSLAAEEDRRRDMVEELSGLLGGELSCGDVSRLAMGLERIEREQPAAAAGDGDGEEGEGEPRGRAWVLEQLRQCLHARAAAQDHLRSSADEIAADMFEAEEGLMGFEPGPGGGQGADNASQISCPPPADVWSAGSEGVARARAAASEALAKSLRLARERVEQLEALTAEVRSGKGRKRTVGCSTAGAGTGVAPVPGEEKQMGMRAARPDAEAVVTQTVRPPPGAQHDGGGDIGADDRADGATAAAAAVVDVEAVGTGGSSSDGSWLFPSSDQEGNKEAQAGGPEERTAVGDGVSAEEIPDLAAPADPPDIRADDNGEQLGNALAPENLAAASAMGMEGNAGVLAGAAETNRSIFENGGSSGGSGCSEQAGASLSPQARAGTGGRVDPADAASALEEAERWKTAARRSDASLADLRETLGDVLALSFRCGQESARRREGEQRPRNERDEASRGDPGSVLGVEVANEGQGQMDSGSAAERSGGVSESAVGGEGGGGGFCCGRGVRCSSCEAKAAAVEVLLKRLEALSVDQGSDIARLEASLRLPRHPGEPRAEVGERVGGGGAEDERTVVAAAAAASKAEGMAIAPPSSLASGSATSAAPAARVEAGERGVSPGGGLGRERERGGDKRMRGASPPADIRTEWEELEGLDTHLAHYQGGGGLGSPAVQGVLDRWIDVNKRNILEGWLGHVLHGGPVDAANGNFVPRVQMSSLSKEVRDGLVSVVLPLLLARRGVLLQVLTRERVELVHDIQIRVTPVAGRRDGPHNTGGGRIAGMAVAVAGRRRPPADEREHGARIRDMVMKAAHVGYVEEDEGPRGVGEDAAAWRTPLASVDSLSRQLKDTWENFNANLAALGAEPIRTGEGSGGGRGGGHRRMLPEY
eukprot:g2626.t1